MIEPIVVAVATDSGVDPFSWTPDPGMGPGEGGPDGSSIEVSRGVPS